MNVLLILQGAPYGSESVYKGLPLAGSLVKEENVELRVFLIGDAASSARAGQKVPQGYYNVQTMLAAVVGRNGTVGVCGSCMDELTRWTVEADKVITF